MTTDSNLGAFAQGALRGVRVLDLSRVVAGPYVGRLFADLGADVIKVEPPEGDQVRRIAASGDEGQSAFYTFANVGKRGLCIDLKQPAGVGLLLELAAHCDVVVENFRPGVLDRLGVGYASLRAVRERIVLLSLNGYGSDSEHAQRMAYAPILHAATGILSDQSEYSGQPVAQRNEAHADTITALHGGLAVLAALRAADATGRGQHIEVPMFDAVLTTYSEAYNALLPEADDRRMNPLFDAGPHGAIATAGDDRWVWRCISQHHALADPAPKDADRDTKAKLRKGALERWMASIGDRAALLESIQAAGIACAAVASMRDALTGAVATERELLVQVDDRRGGTRPVIRPAARFSGSANAVRGPAPLLGEHNASVLRELLGYDEERIRTLRDSGVLAADD